MVSRILNIFVENPDIPVRKALTEPFLSEFRRKIKQISKYEEQLATTVIEYIDIPWSILFIVSSYIHCPDCLCSKVEKF